MNDTSRETVEALAVKLAGRPEGCWDCVDNRIAAFSTLRALLDERDKLLAEREWRTDMENAMSHDVVLAFDGEYVEMTIPHKDGEWRVVNGRGVYINPTHWMPLPTAPVQP